MTSSWLLLYAGMFVATWLVFVGGPARFSRYAPLTIVPVLVALTVHITEIALVWDSTNIDLGNFQLAADLVRDRHDVYSAPWPSGYFPFHPYLPLYMYWLAAADWIAGASRLPFEVVVKVPSAVAYAGCVYLVGSSVSRMRSPATGAWWALLLAVNPVALWIVAIHGQFDAVPLFFLIGAWYLLRFSGRGAAPLAGLSVGLAIALKTWPVLAVPALLIMLRGRDQWLQLLAGTVAVPLICVLAYALAFPGASPADIVRSVWDYRGVPGLSGYTRVAIAFSLESRADVNSFAIDHGTKVLAAIIVAALLLLRRSQPIVVLSATLVLFYVATPSGSGQYLIWVLPFAALAGHTGWLMAFTLAVGFGEQACGIAQVSPSDVCPAFVERHDTLAAIPAWAVAVAWGCWIIARYASSPIPVELSRHR